MYVRLSVCAYSQRLKHFPDSRSIQYSSLQKPVEQANVPFTQAQRQLRFAVFGRSQRCS